MACNALALSFLASVDLLPFMAVVGHL